MATLLPKRDRARTVALSALALSSLSFVGGLFYLQSRANAAPVVSIRQAPDRTLIAETEASKKEKILDLRDKWQVWAKAHQPELLTMLRAQPNDMVAMNAVADAIPALPSQKECGISLEDLEGSTNFSDPVVIQFSWNHGLRDAEPATPDLAELTRKAKEHMRMYDHDAFLLKHDVMVVSASSSWSKKNYCLWASGRIDECEYIIPGDKQKYVSIAPAYDFLVSPQEKP